MEIKKSGIITILGRPNVGKSTLLNAFMGRKISIVTNKPQTTRNRIFAVLNRDETQFVFMDTPGFHKPRSRLGEYMVRAVRESIADVDAVMLITEPIDNIGAPERELLERIKEEGIPAVLVINKIDTVSREELLPIMATYGEAFEFDAIVPVSAKLGDGVAGLLDKLESYIPEGPQLFPEDMVSDQPERHIISEIVREKLLMFLDKEIPHGTAVAVERFEEQETLIKINAVIFCEKDSHKGIIIGKNGAMLKKVGEAARIDIERFLGQKVFLETWVKVKENWRDNPNFIRSLGYE